MPWAGPALLFVRRSEQIGSLRAGITNVLAAVDNGRARVIILARDAHPRLREQIHVNCAGTLISIFEVPDRQELGNAAVYGGPTPICALVADDQDQQRRNLIASWETMLYAIWNLQIELAGYDP